MLSNIKTLSLLYDCESSRKARGREVYCILTCAANWISIDKKSFCPRRALQVPGWRKMARGLWVKKNNPVITFIEMRLSTLPLILQINFDSHLYGTGERDHPCPWGVSKVMKLDQCTYLQWLYSLCLIFYFFTLWAFIHVLINIKN